MKSTTKILIGILISGIVVVLIGSVLLYTYNAPKKGLTFDSKLTQVNVPPFRVVNVLVDSTGQLPKEYGFLESELSIVPVIGSQNTLSYPERLEPYLSITTKNDTVNLIFNISSDALPGELSKKKQLYFELLAMKLTADSSLVAVSSEARGLKLRLCNMKADSVALNVYAYSLKVDSCDLRSLSVKKAATLELVNSRIGNTYLDLDDVSRWSVTNCKLDNEYLTGSRNHRNELQKGECRQMHWMPKNKDARLSVTFNEEVSVSTLKR